MADTFEYITKQGQRWDQIAFAAYGKASLMQTIMDANPSVALYDKLPAGIILQIPVLEEYSVQTDAEFLPPWKRNLTTTPTLTDETTGTGVKGDKGDRGAKGDKGDKGDAGNAADTSAFYLAETVANYSAAVASATGSQKKIITVTVDDSDGSGTQSLYMYNGHGALGYKFPKNYLTA